MEHITLGYDGTQTGQSGLDWVIDRCNTREAQVTIVEISGPGYEAGDVLDDAARAVRERAPATRAITARVRGDIAIELADIGVGADLLVLGVRPDVRLRALMSRMLPLRVTARAHLPVVLVPRGWQPRRGSIVVGIDDDDSSNPAVGFAVREAAADGSPLHLVHAWLTGSPAYPLRADRTDSSTTALEMHRRILARAAQHARDQEPRLEITESLVRDNPVSALSHRAHEATMIVIGTHGRGPVAGVLLGSVAWDLLGNVPTPLCVVPRQRYGTSAEGLLARR
jgi:nucleotide-binding universal stress UspA family protein